jgi:hypothetical protein
MLQAAGIFLGEIIAPTLVLPLPHASDTKKLSLILPIAPLSSRSLADCENLSFPALLYGSIAK